MPVIAVLILVVFVSLVRKGCDEREEIINQRSQGQSKFIKRYLKLTCVTF
jgi:hypothetical protein